MDPSSPATDVLQSQQGTIQPSALYSPSLFSNMSPQMENASPALSNSGANSGGNPTNANNSNISMNSPFMGGISQGRSHSDAASVSPHQRPTPLPAQLLQEVHSGSNSPMIGQQQGFQGQSQQQQQQANQMQNAGGRLSTGTQPDNGLGSDISQQFNGGNDLGLMYQQQMLGQQQQQTNQNQNQNRMFPNQNQASNQNQNQGLNQNQNSNQNLPLNFNPNQGQNQNQHGPGSGPNQMPGQVPGQIPPGQVPGQGGLGNQGFLSTLTPAQLQPIRNQLRLLSPQNQEEFIRRLGMLPPQNLIQAIQQLASQQQKMAAAQNSRNQAQARNQMNQRQPNQQLNQLNNQQNQPNVPPGQQNQFQFVMQQNRQKSPQVNVNQPSQIPPNQKYPAGGPSGPMGPNNSGTSGPGGLNMSSAAASTMSKADQFVKSLFEFMQRRGTPINSFPTVGESRVHPFALYATVMKFGGSAKVTRAQQWPNVTQALGYMPSMSEEVSRIYNNILRPFEEFLLTSQLRNKGLKANLPGQAGQVPMGQVPSPSPAQGPIKGPGMVPGQVAGPGSNQDSNQGPNVPQTPFGQQAQPSPQVPQSQMPMSMIPMQMGQTPQTQIQQQQPPSGLRQSATPQPQTKARQTSQSRGKQTASPIPVHMPGPMQSPAVGGSPEVQAKLTPRRTPSSRKSSTASSPALVPVPALPAASPTPIIKPKHFVPHENRKYAPKKRLVEKHGGYDIRVLAGIGREIENIRSDFPFTHELGTFDVHAITMAVNSTIAGEVRQALDKLMVITADPRCYFSLVESPGLLTGLAECGLVITKGLASSKPDGKALATTKHYDVNDSLFGEGVKSNIDAVFESYKSKLGKEDVDLVIDVDTLTGVEVGRVEDDKPTEKIQEDDISVHKKAEGQESKDTINEKASEQDGLKPFGFTNYLTLLKKTSSENEELEFDYKTPEIDQFWVTASVDRLLSITTILRNLSFVDQNRSILINEPTSREFLFGLLYSLAENANLLPNSKQTLDLMKDLVTIFSNLAPVLILDSAKDALVLLLFILAFTPTPIPLTTSKDGIVFGRYTPVVHRYLPYAVDILAKVLPRDPPNRDLFESIFLGTCTNFEYLQLLQRYFNGRPADPYELMTCAFGLVISTVPHDDLSVIPRGLELARPLLHQSLLVAEMLAEMIKFEKPTRSNTNGTVDADEDNDIEMSESDKSFGKEKEQNNLSDFLKEFKEKKANYNLAYEWLSASDGFGHALLRAACALGAVVGNGRARDEERNPFARITQRSITVLRILGKKAMEYDSQDGALTGSEKAIVQLPSGVLPTIEALLGAMLASEMDKYVVGQICRFCDEGNEHLIKASSSLERP
ncbi:Swi1p [Sugiyamaella lignohabitans]|uniref:Swi1p n=1 Tax=Sugiyamaella lignohabitans TaxID=796027 RepID=A0A167E6C6_9ASCO|nr:Swi1p [Sugiyamaella lignohabitans]ANB13699.1 Swi1p [Sugiyamaella lignohabitans]